MPNSSQIFSPGLDSHTVRSADGSILSPPEDWVLLPPGDATLTRRVKAAGPSWTVQEKRGRKIFSQGVWAPRTVVEAVRAELAAERSTPQFHRRQEAEARRRQKLQEDYTDSFLQAVVTFLSFDARYADLAGRLARAVTEHATPVGSGTVARTKRIPLEDRAAAAVIAWMRHQTTGYEKLVIPRQKGKRREVRRLLARQSEALLEAYRTGQEMDAARCPLQQALARPTGES